MAVDPGSAAVVGGVVGIAIALVRVIERLIDSKKVGKSQPPCAGIDRAIVEAVQRLDRLHQVRDDGISASVEAIQRLDRLHSKTDDDGRPIWYFPSKVQPTLEQIREGITKLGETQAETCRVMKDTLRHIKNGSNGSR